MRIVMISPHATKIKGGMSTVVENYIKYNKRDDLEIIYIYSTEGGSCLNKIVSAIKASISLLKTLMFGEIDIVHIHIASGISFYRKSIFCLISRMFKKKYILHLHGGGFDKFYSKQKDIIKRYINFIFDKSSMILVLSDSWIEIVKKYSDTQVKVLKNAIKIPKYNNYSDNKKNILMLGRLTAKKGIYDLLDVAELVLRKDSEVKFLVAGDGELDKVNKIIQEKAIKENFELLGWIDEKTREEILKETMIYILPSYYEAMPMSILEAMSYGIPVISTKVGSIPEVINEESNGYLLEPGDINGFARGILNIVSNSELRNNISKNNFKFVNKEFNIERHIDSLYDIYRNLIK